MPSPDVKDGIDILQKLFNFHFTNQTDDNQSLSQSIGWLTLPLEEMALIVANIWWAFQGLLQLYT